jgi:hypothetical protein
MAGARLQRVARAARLQALIDAWRKAAQEASALQTQQYITTAEFVAQQARADVYTLAANQLKAALDDM